MLARAHALIIHFSDVHSAYDRFPDFIRAITVLRADYLRRVPDGRTILLINGDFSGASSFSRDRGNLGYAVLGELASDWEIVMNLGNHEAFDWPGVEGQELFLAQLRGLQARYERVRGQSFAITTANIVPTEISQNLFRTHHDISLSSGVQLRFIGITLRRFYAASGYDTSVSPQTVAQVLPSEETLQSALQRSIDEGVKHHIVMVHEGSRRVANIASSIVDWRDAGALNRESRGELQLPLFFAAHDHVPAARMIGSSRVLDSGFGLQFHSLELDAQAEVVGSPVFYPPHLQASLKPRFNRLATPAARKALELVERILPPILAENAQIVARTGGFIAEKATLTAGPALLGNALADALGMSAANLLATIDIAALTDSEGVITFFNSSSYRLEAPLAPGELTYGNLIGLSPMPDGGIGVYRARGRDIQRLYRAIREARAREDRFSPQINARTRESTNSNDPLGLEYQEDNGQWHRLRRERFYVLVLDPWLSRNGYRIPGVDEFLQRHRNLIPETERISLVEALRRSLNYCERFLMGDRPRGAPRRR